MVKRVGRRWLLIGVCWSLVGCQPGVSPTSPSAPVGDTRVTDVWRQSPDCRDVRDVRAGLDPCRVLK